MKLFLSALLILAIVSCKENKKESVNSEPPTPVATAPTENKSVEAYTSFIQKLDTSKVGSVSIAAKQFNELLSNSDTARADSAFIVFSHFYDKVLNYLNEQHIKDKTDYSAYIKNGKNQKGTKTSTADTYVSTLKQNGFTLEMSEGSTFVRQQRSFLSTYFYPYISATLKEYLVQVDKENEEGFIEDAGLVIKPIKLSDRILYWDHFLSNYPTFHFSEEIKQNKKGYTTFLLEGLSNTPLLNMDTNKLSADFKVAFDHVLETAPQSHLAGLVKPYYFALLKSDNKTASALLLKYKKQGIIYDYSA